MNIKNNILVKITAIIFMMMMTGIFYASVYNHFFKQEGGGFVAAIFIGGLLLLLFIVLIGTKLASLENKEKHFVYIIFEILAAGFMMIHGIIIRTMPQIIFNSQNTAYFDVSVSLQKGMILSNMDIVIQNILDMPSLFGYGKFISYGFALFGTKPEVMFYNNLIFQMLGIFFLYRIARRLAGSLCGVLTLFVSVYLPSSVFAVYSFNNAAMFSCVLFGALLLFLYLSDRYYEKNCDFTGMLGQCLLGLLLGLMVFMEPISAILVLIVFIVQLTCRNRRLLRAALTMITAFAVFASLLWWMSGTLSLDYGRCLQAYGNEWIPDFVTGGAGGTCMSVEQTIKQLGLIVSESGNDISLNYESLLYQDGIRLTLAFVGLLQVVNHFFYLWILLSAFIFGLCLLLDRNLQEKELRTVPFMWLGIGILIMMFLHMNRMYHTTYCIGMLLILSSVSLRYLYQAFQNKPVKVSKESTEVKQEEAPVTETKEIQYIENPLPLPKKHKMKNKIDYSVEVPEEQMKYDIEVSDEDDWTC